MHVMVRDDEKVELRPDHRVTCTSKLKSMHFTLLLNEELLINFKHGRPDIMFESFQKIKCTM